MSNSKITVILDWSNLMFRSLFMNSLFSQSSISYDDPEDVTSFIGKFCTDIAFLLKTFNPSNVILATDAANPWRKEILKEDIIGYKSNRQKSANINWENIFNGSNDLLKILEDKGFSVAQVERGEADDIIALCKEVAFEKFPETNLIVISADADIRQIIDFDVKTHQYCLVYNTIQKGKTGKRYLYAPKEFIDWFNIPEVNDIFFSNHDVSKDYIKNILDNNQNIELIEENPNDIVLSKIFCGDDGDCVPSFYEYYKNGKKVRVTPGRYTKVCESLQIKSVKDLIAKEPMLKTTLESVMKLESIDLDFNERLNRQRTLVELNSELFPNNLQEYKDTIFYMLQKSISLDLMSISSNQLLANSKYGKALEQRKRKIEKEVFKDIEKYTDKLNKLW